MDFLIVGNGMFGAAIARHLAPYAKVTVVGPEARGTAAGDTARIMMRGGSSGISAGT